MSKENRKRYDLLWGKLMRALTWPTYTGLGKSSFGTLMIKLKGARENHEYFEHWNAGETAEELLEGTDKARSPRKHRTQDEILNDPLTQMLATKSSRAKIANGWGKLLEDETTREGAYRVLELLLRVGSEQVSGEVKANKKLAAKTIDELNRMTSISGVQYDEGGNASRVEDEDPQ